MINLEYQNKMNYYFVRILSALLKGVLTQVVANLTVCDFPLSLFIIHNFVPKCCRWNKSLEQKRHNTHGELSSGYSDCGWKISSGWWGYHESIYSLKRKKFLHNHLHFLGDNSSMKTLTFVPFLNQYLLFLRREMRVCLWEAFDIPSRS